MIKDSPLVSVVIPSPNFNPMKNKKNLIITPHCVVGQMSAKRIGEIFQDPLRGASSNYGIGCDGDIGQYVSENDRSWCTSSKTNDEIAVTIEVASDTTHPYTITSKAYESLVNLCIDICKRNDIPKLIWHGDKTLLGEWGKQNITVHRWYANKSCPGDYIYNLLGKITDEVNASLSGEVENMTIEELKLFIQNEIKHFGEGLPASKSIDEQGIIKDLKNEGITDGSNPQSLATREQVMAMIHRSM